MTTKNFRDLRKPKDILWDEFKAVMMLILGLLLALVVIWIAGQIIGHFYLMILDHLVGGV